MVIVELTNKTYLTHLVSINCVKKKSYFKEKMMLVKPGWVPLTSFNQKFVSSNPT
jgi:hypothetical protein